MASPFTADQPFKENNVINESERDAIPANDVGKLVQLEADGALSKRFMAGVDFGDGSDGDIVISSNTTLTRSMNYNNLTINSGVTLNTNGYLIYVKEVLSGAGKIEAPTGANGSNGVGGNGGTGGVSNGFFIKTTTGGNGATGGNGVGVSASSQSLIGIGGLSAAGGNGGSTAGGFTAGGAGAVPVRNRTTFPFGIFKLFTYIPISIESTGLEIILGAPQSGGGGSGGGNGGSAQGRGGGGGGASGGLLFVACNELQGTLTFETIGGNGGNGADGSASGTDLGGGGGGAGGNGGSLILLYKTKTGTYTATLTGGTAGTGGTGIGTGVNGTNGSTGVAGTVYEIQATSLV